MFWGPFHAFRRLGPYLRPYWTGILAVFALGGAASILGLTQPYLSKGLVDQGLLGRNPMALAEAALLMLAFSLAGFGLNYASSYLYVRISARMLFDMRLALFRHLHTLSPRFFAKTKLGEIVSRLNNDLGEVQRVTADLPLSALTQAIFFTGSLALMASLSGKLTLLSLILAPAGLYLYQRMQGGLGARTRLVRDRSANLGSFLIQSLMAQRLAASTNGLEREAARFRAENDRFLDALLGLQRISLLAGVLPGTLTAASTALVFLYGGHLILQGELTLGGLVAFLAYHARLLAPVQSILAMSFSVTMARVSLDRVMELFETPPDTPDPAQPAPVPDGPGAIEFRSVTAPGSAIQGLSAQIPGGTFCAILGPSGSGKSTLGDLLVRFQDPAEGEIRLDGAPLRSLLLRDLRSAVYLVDQNPLLLNFSVRENLRYAAPDAADADLERAAAAAGVLDLLDRETAGERGLALSAGERQRIALAQALLRHPRVLVLDEPTAALDADNENRVIELLKSEWRGVTRIVLTHSDAVAAAAQMQIRLGEPGNS
jgi:ATP-binding cassette subfamily B protein